MNSNGSKGSVGEDFFEISVERQGVFLQAICVCARLCMCQSEHCVWPNSVSMQSAVCLEGFPNHPECLQETLLCKQRNATAKIVIC